jgi:tripartite-type tricarboxylate transporter receptor subunit TctC
MWKLPARLVSSACALSAVAMIADHAYGQNYPSRPLRFLTTGVGGSTDYAARVLAEGLAAGVNWHVVVENRGSTIVASDTVAKASPDGYTLLVTTDGHWRGPTLQKFPFDAIKDFTPIALISRAPNILVVHPSVPVNNVKELIALAKSKPGSLHYGAGAIAASTHLASELFNIMAGVKIVFVPYKSSGVAVGAIVGGQIQVMFATSSGITPHIKSGRVRALAVSTAAPTALLPDLPTIAAAGGLPGYESVSTAALLGPARLPEPLLSLLNREARRALNRSDVKERFFNAGVEIVGGTPAEALAFIKADTVTTARIVKEANIKLE